MIFTRKRHQSPRLDPRGLDSAKWNPSPRRALSGTFSAQPVSFGLLLVAVVSLWYLVARIGVFPSYMLPKPEDVFQALVTHRSLLLDDAYYTASNAAPGLALAFVTAFVVSVAVVHSAFVRNMTLPFIVGLEAMPKLAFAPLLVVWFGIGVTPKIVLACSIAFFPIVINLMRGLSNVDPDIIAFTRVTKASWLKTLFYVRLPNSLIPLFDGLRIALPGAIIGAVLGEFIASDRGLGHRALVSNAALKLDMVFAALIVLAILSIGGFLLIRLAERKLIVWRSD